METKFTTANKVKTSNQVGLGFIRSLKAKTNIVVSSMLVFLAGSTFSSCNKDGDELVSQSTPIQIHEKYVQETRSLHQGNYTVQSVYKNNYKHYRGVHNIAPGFVSWWNCIANAEGAGTITIDDIIRLGVGNNAEVDLRTLENSYPGLQISGYRDGVAYGSSAQDLLENYFINVLDGGQPCAVLYNNNYNGQWKNVLVVVLTYKNGQVYYQDPIANTLGSTSLSSFASKAKAASTSQTINVIHW